MAAPPSPTFIAEIRSLLNEVSSLATILGFGVLGVIVALRFVITRTLAFTFAVIERWRLGRTYEVMRSLAIEDGAFNPTKSIRLRPVLIAKADQTRAEIGSYLSDRLDARLGRLASGSTQLRNVDLLTERALLLPLTFNNELDGRQLDFADLTRLVCASEAKTDIGRALGVASPAKRHLLIGPAGRGKSLTCLAIEKDFSDSQPKERRWILNISAEDFADHDERSPMAASIGDESWCVGVLSRRLGWQAPSELRRRTLTRELVENAVIIIDGLDEIAVRLDRNSFELLLQSWLLQRATLLTARGSFYYATLEGHPAIKNHLRYTLQTAPPIARYRFMRRVCEILHGELAMARLYSLEQLINHYGSLVELTETPLLLMMLLEIDQLENWTDVRADSVRVYEEFVRQILDREALRLGGKFSREVLLMIYQNMARMLSGAPTDDIVQVGLMPSQLSALLACAVGGSPERRDAVLLDAFMASPLVAVIGESSLRGVGLQVRFTHESFAEFLVAQWAFSWMTGASHLGEDFFSQLETPGTSAFLKEYLERTKYSRSLSRVIGARLVPKLEGLIAADKTTDDEGLARRQTFAAGQLAYYLGMVDDSASRLMLTTLTLQNGTFWIRRAAAIGLAFGGAPGPLDHLIDEM